MAPPQNNRLKIELPGIVNNFTKCFPDFHFLINSGKSNILRLLVFFSSRPP